MRSIAVVRLLASSLLPALLLFASPSMAQPQPNLAAVDRAAERLKGGFHVTVVHNDLLRSSPDTIYMHIQARGDPAQLAAAFLAQQRWRLPVLRG